MPQDDLNTRVTVLEAALKATAENDKQLNSKLDAILMQLQKLSVLEERQATHHEDFDRLNSDSDLIWKAINELRAKTHAVELEYTAFSSYAKGQSKLVYALLGVAGGIFVKMLFFASANGMSM